jgi:CBS domain-containing protein
MTVPAFGMAVGTPIAMLARVMVDDRVRCVPIVDGSQVVGVVTRRDLVRAMARTDTSIAADVRRRLEIYGGARKWAVSVRDGAVTIGAEFSDPESDRVVTALAEGVLGVASARVLVERELA